MDDTDVRLLMLLSRSPRAPYRELADDLRISVQAVHRRIQILRERKVLVGFTANLSLPGYSDAFSALPPTPLHLAFVVLPATVLYVWVYNNTGRSVLAVMVFHFMGNFSGEFLGISETALTAGLVLTAVAVVVIVWCWGPGTLRRDLRIGIPTEAGPYPTYSCKRPAMDRTATHSGMSMEWEGEWCPLLRGGQRNVCGLAPTVEEYVLGPS